MEFDALLMEFAAKIGLETLRPDADGCLALLFDEAHEIIFAKDERDDAILFWSEIGNSGGLDKDGCMKLLTASLLGAKTGGAALAVHDRLEKIVLWKRHDNRFEDCADFEKAINAFLGEVIHWKEELTNAAQEAEAQPEPAGMNPFMDLRV